MNNVHFSRMDVFLLWSRVHFSSPACVFYLVQLRVFLCSEMCQVLANIMFSLPIFQFNATCQKINHCLNFKGFDALRHVVDHKTQKELGVNRPLLTVSICCQMHQSLISFCFLFETYIYI